MTLPPALQEGAVFAGRYRVLGLIAAGGMGAVYEARHLETERLCALKVMLPHILDHDELRERFKREAKVAAQIESDFIVAVFDAGVDEATRMPFLVMERLRGEDLGARLKRLGRLPPAEVALWVHQTARALDKTRCASIVHRDLKPANLFLADRDEGPPRIKVLDFGVAKILAESTADQTKSVGTPLYMAPEQFDPRLPLTGAADVFALGMVAYTLLAGAPYWLDEARAGNAAALVTVAMHGPRQPASTRAAARGVTLPPAFDAWFARVTAEDPAQRFPSATEAARTLADALGVPLPAHEAHPSLPEPAPSVVALLRMDQSTAPYDPAPRPGPESAPSGVLAMSTSSSGLTTTARLPRRSRSRVVVVSALGLAAVAATLGAAGYLAQSRGSAASAPSASSEVPAPSISATSSPAAVPAPSTAVAQSVTVPDVSAMPPPAKPKIAAPPPRRTRTQY